ncbi:hypothetical protein PG996_005114 [Apiospora saccharicola]|uniref:RRM domain-containing protein n=1 Tax=Apiospora saccharicola TaxID=335842 RepID=A0ABR1VNA8_9PEZI
MDRRALMRELREGSVPASPPGRVGAELAPGWDRPVSGQSAAGSVPIAHTQQVSAGSHVDLLSFDIQDQQVNTERSPSLLIEGTMAGMTLTEDDAFGPEVHQAINWQVLSFTAPSHSASDHPAAFHSSAVAGPETEFHHAFRDDQTHSQASHGSYRGSVNANETFVAEDDNCCLFLTGFPADITVHQFVDQVQTYQLGKIAAIHINPPSGTHPTAAIKVTMWTRVGAERVHDAIQSRQITFQGHHLRAAWNRNRLGPRPVSIQNESRVLLVIGRSEILDRIYVKRLTSQIMFVFYGFGSYINQAQNAYRMIIGSFDPAHVFAMYRQDPFTPVAAAIFSEDDSDDDDEEISEFIDHPDDSVTFNPAHLDRIIDETSRAFTFSFSLSTSTECPR